MATDPLDFLDSEPSQTETDQLSFLGEDVSKGRSLASAFPKGLIKGSRKFSPIPSVGPIPNKLAEKLIEQFLPTQEGNAEDILEFAGEHAPLAAFGEGGLVSKALQTVGGALGKKTAKEMELPEWAQDLAGGIGMSVPAAGKSVFSKSLVPSDKQKSVVDFLKSHGFNEKEITPLIQDKKMLSWLSKGAMKYEEKSPFLKGIQDKLGGIYENVRTQGQQGNYLQGQPLRQFEKSFHDLADKIPKRHRRLIEKEIEELFNNPIDFTSLHDFNVAVNDIIKGTTGGKASIGKLKIATHDAQKKLDPALFNDLRKTDKVYSSLMNFTDKMTKKNWEGIAKLGDAGKVVIGALIFNPGMIGVGAKGLAAVAASRYALKQLLVNPRLQNLHIKLQNAVSQNKASQALKIAEMIKKELEDKIEENKSIPEDKHQNT
jgi:hypothetical protein